MFRIDRKRAFDLALAIPLFVLTLPIQGFVGLLVLFKLGRPVIFSQVRPGYRGRPFVMRKFRTMRPVSEDLGLVDDAARLTDFGRFLRSTSLDELPALWNVLRGEMSLVGPRPLLMEYLDRYSAEQGRRHDRPPGLTGLAQISGRNEISWEERLRLDVLYVERQSLVLDLRILLRTLRVVVGRRGVSQKGWATMSPFRGSQH